MASSFRGRSGVTIEDQLRERLSKVETPLLLGAATVGEPDAAGAAAERLRAKLE